LDAEFLWHALPLKLYNMKTPENLQMKLINLQWEVNLETRRKK